MGEIERRAGSGQAASGRVRSDRLRNRIASQPPRFRPIALRNGGSPTNERAMSDRSQTLAKILELVEPFNKKGIDVGEATRFAQDLEWDSLTVLNFVAEVEDEFDVLIPVNMQAEIETVGQLADALQKMNR
jgi:acyl carrier protein